MRGAVRMALAAAAILLPGPAVAQAARSGNPILPGWYADPEAHVLRTTLSLPDLLGP
jgi:hypothetical protein